ncbi:hypothetical protein F511_08663 [Dorcoceras hygrometricum]|uniref:Uncharacterized protein n=1 Tax=Dorcoceras hygrometricum TaxID=472368 RepID=A0A2Z7ACT9_9LAMI|nr:hypothetical protein F511_08663 [Dorcoceras hygrometricum]
MMRSIIVFLVMVLAVAGGRIPAAAPPLSSAEFLQVSGSPTAVQPLIMVEEDYGIWNPSPYFGGGDYGGPIPHAMAHAVHTSRN